MMFFLYTSATFVVLVAVFLAVDAYLVRRERRERDRWYRDFGGRGYAAPVAEERRDG